MGSKYNQSKALGAITKASFLASLKNPQSFVFSLIFPLVFVFIFGAFSGNSLTRFNLALSPTCDTTNILYKTIASQPFIIIKSFGDTVEMRKELEKGTLSGIMNIQKSISLDTSSQKAFPHFDLTIKSTSASSLDIMQLIPLLENLSDKLEKRMNGNKATLVTIKQDIYNVREYKTIDFVLPGQIGFSLLFSTLFGIGVESGRHCFCRWSASWGGRCPWEGRMPP